MRFMDCLKQALAEHGALDPDAFQPHIARIERLFEEQLNASGARDLPGVSASLYLAGMAPEPIFRAALETDSDV